MSMFVKNTCAGCWGEAGACTCPDGCTCYSCTPVPDLEEKLTVEQEEVAKAKDEQLKTDLLKEGHELGRSMGNSFIDGMKRIMRMPP